MTTSNSTTTATEIPVPFFEDRRSLPQKLQVDRRDWMPTKAESNSPSMIFGLVIERSTFQGKNKVHPTARILTETNIEWGVIAFHGWLDSEFERKNPRVGDFVAIAYTGTRPSRREGDSPAYTYVLEVQRNPAGTNVEADTTSRDPSDPGPEPPAADPLDDDIPF